ncbi:MAG: substrate-binding domain-containing protein [Ruminococcus sp.]|nr:substrate-binding domain-containing protein [Ruminococcus sp.]
MKTTVKRLVSIIAAAAVATTMLAGCSDDDSESGATGAITVISREDGSGTRSAFIELTGIQEEDEDGNKSDMTSSSALVSKSTDAVLTQVSGDVNAIGYISLGSLNDSVKALKVEGVEVTAENIKADEYAIARPFNIATKGDISAQAQDFITFILSADGQQIVSDEGYVTIDDDAEAYEAADVSGEIKIEGSSSVTPLMTKLKEAYEEINSDVSIEIQQTDSSSGMKTVAEEGCDIGMASRDLKDDEASELDGITIARDGIAVIVNKNNDLEDISLETIKSIYVGDITEWEDVA